MNILDLIHRNATLFEEDINKQNESINLLIESSSFLVIGGAGSIGQAVTKEIFKRNPKILHVVDINENNLVELVRDLRSSIGYIEGNFKTFAIDCGGNEFEALINNNDSYDYILNLSALKHVRSEKDPYTLMRLIQVNILNTIKTINLTKEKGTKKYFCVSTDKAANPVNMMGASKRIMEMFLMRESESIEISTARFANVAFSDGSLLHGFNQRFAKRQPISAPHDIKRYFVTPQESGELCLMSCLFGENRDIYFPKLSEKLHLITFSDIAERYIKQQGYEPYHCSTEQEARDRSNELIAIKKWPCYFFKSDTSGEKDFEEFYMDNEILELNQFKNIGIIKNDANYNNEILERFLCELENIKLNKVWKKTSIVELFNSIIRDFNHKETGKYLDGRM
jgi:FlaA1/EpsC-like NDP-sugar epimerase